MRKSLLFGIVLFPLFYCAQVGINTPDPTSTLDINGNGRVRALPQATGATFITPVYSDANGNLLKASTSANFQGLNSNVVTVGSGATAALITGLTNGGGYKVIVTSNDGCAYSTIAEFYVINYSFNGNVTIKGRDGIFSGGSTAVTKTPAFTESAKNSTGVVWSGQVGCSDGGNNTAFNYTLTMPSAGTINITNNGNISKNYTISVMRVN